MAQFGAAAQRVQAVGGEFERFVEVRQGFFGGAQLDEQVARQHVRVEAHRARAASHLARGEVKNYAAAEHGIGEIKRESELDLRVPGSRSRRKDGLVDPADARARIGSSIERLDQHRLRATRGWLTAVQVDAEMPPWHALVTRSDVRKAASCAIREAVKGSKGRRARRLAHRRAIFGTLEMWSSHDNPRHLTAEPFQRGSNFVSSTHVNDPNLTCDIKAVRKPVWMMDAIAVFPPTSGGAYPTKWAGEKHAYCTQALFLLEQGAGEWLPVLANLAFQVEGYTDVQACE